MHLIRVPFTTSAGGAATKTTPVVNGKLHQVYYDAGDMDTGADITVAGAKTGLQVLALTNAGTGDLTLQPRCPTHDKTGAASLYAATGEPVEDRYAIAEALTVTVAQGGVTKSGELILWIED